MESGAWVPSPEKKKKRVGGRALEGNLTDCHARCPLKTYLRFYPGGSTLGVTRQEWWADWACWLGEEPPKVIIRAIAGISQLTP